MLSPASSTAISRWALALLVWVVAGCASNTDWDDGRTPVTAPYERTDGGSYVVPVRIGDSPRLRLVVDTGSSVSGLYAHAVERLGIPLDPDRTATVRGLQSITPQPVLPVSTLALGGARQTVSRMVVLPNPVLHTGTDGILGMDFLQHYAMVFEDPVGTIRFVPNADFDSRRYRRWDKAPLTGSPAGGSYPFVFAQMRIGPVTMPALVDLGSEATIINEAAADAIKRAFPDLRRIIAAQALADANDTDEAPNSFAVVGLGLGDHKWGPKRVLILPLDPLAPLGAARGPFAIVGTDLLGGETFVLDVAQRVLWIDPHGSGAASP